MDPNENNNNNNILFNEKKRKNETPSTITDKKQNVSEQILKIYKNLKNLRVPRKGLK